MAGNLPVIKRSLFRFKTNYCEIIGQGCFHRARTKVRVSKTSTVIVLTTNHGD